MYLNTAKKTTSFCIIQSGLKYGLCIIQSGLKSVTWAKPKMFYRPSGLRHVKYLIPGSDSDPTRVPVPCPLKPLNPLHLLLAPHADRPQHLAATAALLGLHQPTEYRPSPGQASLPPSPMSSSAVARLWRRSLRDVLLRGGASARPASTASASGAAAEAAPAPKKVPPPPRKVTPPPPPPPSPRHLDIHVTGSDLAELPRCFS